MHLLDYTKQTNNFNFSVGNGSQGGIDVAIGAAANSLSVLGGFSLSSARGAQAALDSVNESIGSKLGSVHLSRRSLVQRRMKRVFEINPLECPRCKSQMRIVAFLTDEREIIKIADSLCLPRAQAPPKIRRPPQPESFDHFPPDDFSA